VGERVQPFGGGALAVHGQQQVGQRIEHVGVAAVLRDQDVRVEAAQQRRHHRVEGPQPRLVPCPDRQGDVHRAPLGTGAADVLGQAGSGEQGPWMLVQADRQDPGIVPERGLDPVAVVDVHIDVGDAFGALGEEPGDGDRRIVVDAEPRGVRAHRVMQPAGDVHGVPGHPVPHLARGGDRGADDARGGFVHAGEVRVVLGPETETLPLGMRHVRGAPHRRDVVGSVDQFQGLVISTGNSDDLDSRRLQDTERGRERHREFDPHRRERMVVAEVVLQEPVVPRNAQRLSHGFLPPGRAGTRHPPRAGFRFLPALATYRVEHHRHQGRSALGRGEPAAIDWRDGKSGAASRRRTEPCESY